MSDYLYVAPGSTVTDIRGDVVPVNPLKIGSRFPIYIGGVLVWHWVIGPKTGNMWPVRREAEWPPPAAFTRASVHRCDWNDCLTFAFKRHGYWGQYHWLCNEHGALVGDDGSMDEPRA